MREKWEFVEVNKTCKEIFSKAILQELNVRYFDPTLNFHDNSLAKGLIEGLMLKRAKCTLYLIQETDTMGKDSEMAATLAQGKPVIAYISQKSPEEREEALKDFRISELLQKAYTLIHMPNLVEPENIKAFKALANQIGEIKDEFGDNSAEEEKKICRK